MNRLSGWFQNARVRNKILSGFGVVLFLMATVAAVILIQTAQVHELSRESRRALSALRAGDQLEIALLDRVASFREYLITGDDLALERMADADAEWEEHLAALRSATNEAEQLAMISEVEEVIADWESTTVEPGIELRQQAAVGGSVSRDTIAEFFAINGRVAAEQAQSAIEQLTLAQESFVNQASAERDDAIRQIRIGTIAGTVLAMILSILLASWIASSISAGLQRAVKLGAGVASGDLTQRAEVDSRDEVGVLIGTLNRMADDLRKTVSGFSGATTQVATAAEEIAAASEQISQTADLQVRSTEETSSSMEQIAAQIARVANSTESLAASIDQTSTSVTQMSNSIEQTAMSTDTLGASVEQTSATIEEMVTSISQVGRHVEETSNIANTAEEDARAGGEAVSTTIHGMRRIHSQMEALVGTVTELGSASESIGRISEVIESIADQTNLLALNAAIEAARAGEHGRGFSVVAQEIRRLAERSVESTREISSTVAGVIDDMQRVVRSSGDVAARTNEGIQLADSADQALAKIIASSGRTRELMEEVTLATRQQIRAAEQAQEAVRHIQQVTQEVRIATREQATGSRQIADAVENMNQRTREVFSATGEQKKGGEMVLDATQRISQSAVDTQGAIREMTSAAQDLSEQARRLNDLVASFRV